MWMVAKFQLLIPRKGTETFVDQTYDNEKNNQKVSTTYSPQGDGNKNRSPTVISLTSWFQLPIPRKGTETFVA